MHCAHRNPTVPESCTSAMAAQDTAVHETDVLRRLLDDEIVSAQVITPRATSKRFEHLKDPQVAVVSAALTNIARHAHADRADVLLASW